jgi:hypothetical protein
MTIVRGWFEADEIVLAVEPGATCAIPLSLGDPFALLQRKMP